MHGGHKFDPVNRAHLDSAERRAYLDPDRILRSFRIEPRWKIADIGAGVGFFALPAARLVGPQGRVYAVDLAPEMLEDLERKLASAGVANVEPLLSTEDRVPLDDRSVDLAFLACVLHELAGTGTLLECRRILKPRGILAVVDWKKLEQEIGPPRAHRLDEDEARAAIRDAGFKAERTFEAGPYHYAIEARIAHT